MTYTLVTVAHKLDYPLLQLQARSLARYLSPDFMDEIFVVADEGLRGSREWQKPLLTDYGYLADKVHFLDASDVAAIPNNIDGWRSQQIMKLMVARVVSSDRYMVLDAKNHLVFPLSPEFYENGDRIRSMHMNYEALEFRPYLESSLRYFGIAEDGMIRSFLPTITPFIFPTQVVNALIAHTVQREQVPFPLAFGNLRTTEFFLFGGYLCWSPGGIGEFYDMSGPACPVIWPQTAVDGQADVESVAARVEHEHLPFFTVHRKAFPLLDEGSKQVLAALWVRRHLFDDVQHALRFVARVCCRQEVAPEVIRKWLSHPAPPPDTPSSGSADVF
jgi:Family of unknown function (DUF6492)